MIVKVVSEGHDYVPCEVIFPKWKDARPKLDFFCSNTDGWRINYNKITGDIEARLNYPQVMVRDKNLWMEVDMIHTFPRQYRQKIFMRLRGVNTTYQLLPGEMDEYNETNLSDDTILTKFINDVREKFKARERHIVKLGGRTIKQELAFRLGVRK